jgi:DNA-binding MarR family transcriptional regulator
MNPHVFRPESVKIGIASCPSAAIPSFFPRSRTNLNVIPHFPQDSIQHRVAVGLNKIGLALKSQSWQDAGQHGLTPTQGQILTILRSKGITGMRLSAVAEELAVTSATASDAVTTLVEKGLVQKTRAVDDGRAIAISMTPKGLQTAEQVADWPDFLQDAVSELSEVEQEVFLRGLIKMICKLQEQRQISVARMCVNCQFFRPDHYPNSDQPHHCAFVDAPFADRNLQVDCPDQRPVS